MLIHSPQPTVTQVMLIQTANDGLSSIKRYRDVNWPCWPWWKLAQARTVWFLRLVIFRLSPSQLTKYKRPMLNMSALVGSSIIHRPFPVHLTIASENSPRP